MTRDRFVQFLRRMLVVALTLSVVAPPAAVVATVSLAAAPSTVEAQTRSTARKRPARRTTTTRRTTTRRRTATRAPAAPALPAWTTPRGAPALASDLGSFLARQTPDGRWGAMVVSITRGDTLFSVAPDEPRTPASTMKMFTSALALDRLGPNWRFRTDVLRDAAVDASGVVAGNIYLRGDGDPSFSKRFVPGTGLDAPMQALAAQVASAGIRRITGDLVADASAFESRTIPEGWLSRYAGSGYAAPFSALSLNENIVVVAVYPDGRVLLEPATTAITVSNQVRVVGGRGNSLRIYRGADGNVVARGTIGRSAPVRRLQLTVADPALFTAGALRSALAAQGVTVDGNIRMGTTPAGASVVTSNESRHLSDLLAVMNRESINHFAELIFRNAARGPQRDAVGSAEAGNALLQRFLTDKVGATTGAASATDGSGLSVLDRVTPRAMVQMLAYAHKAPWSSAFHASLPVAGESELMRHRMRSTPAQGNLHAKTGTTNDVIGLGGYVTAENGEVLAFSFLFNGRDRWNARATMDRMGATLASFSR